jgi:hypothetical protein
MRRALRSALSAKAAGAGIIVSNPSTWKGRRRIMQAVFGRLGDRQGVVLLDSRNEQ